MTVEKLVFSPYTNQDIFEILSKKLDEMNLTYLFERESLIFISRRFANKSGDIRPALELIKTLLLNNKSIISHEPISNECDIDMNIEHSNKIINSNGIKTVITLKEILLKLGEKQNNFTQIMSNLTDEQKLLVATIYSTLDKDESCEIDDAIVII